MDNPFPGMNPYLEQPELWHQVYNRLIVAIADDLTPQIAPKYQVSIEERVYTSVDDILLVGIADVAVTNRNIIDNNTTLTAAKLAEPSKVKVPVPLREGEPEPIVDLQRLLNEVYKRARFDLAIDYSQPLKIVRRRSQPQASSEEEAWVREVLHRS